jgi:2-haloacid dehalogenase
MDRRTFLGGVAVAGVASLAETRLAAQGGRVLVFDVNETLLDIAALRPEFQRLFGNTDALTDWFSTVLLYSQVTTIAGPYAEFGSIARAALEMTAAARSVALSKADADTVLGGLVSLPAHPDVPDALEMLRTAGFRMVTLTNSAPAAVERQLKNARLAGYFERQLSVDAVRRFKPAAEVYRLVATELGVAAAQLRLVAAHAWDVHGALRAGLTAAFIARPGKVLYPLGEKPDIVGGDLRAVATEILKRDSPK